MRGDFEQKIGKTKWGQNGGKMTCAAEKILG
jgi:hypothetical protein